MVVCITKIQYGGHMNLATNANMVIKQLLSFPINLEGIQTQVSLSSLCHASYFAGTHS